MSTSNQPDTAPFVYVGSETPSCQQMFFDGYSTVLMSPTTSKVTFYQTIGFDPDGREKRKEMLTLVLPTIAMADYCQKFLQNMTSNADAIKSAVDSDFERLLSLETQSSKQKAPRSAGSRS